MSRIFASFGIAKGFASASILTVVASAPALAQAWDLSTAPVPYLQYNLPYYKQALGSFPKDQDSRPKSRVAVGRYEGLYDYAVANAAPMVRAAPIPYIGYDLTPYYNLAPGCPLGNPPGHTPQIC